MRGFMLLAGLLAAGGGVANAIVPGGMPVNLAVSTFGIAGVCMLCAITLAVSGVADAIRQRIVYDDLMREKLEKEMAHRG